MLPDMEYTWVQSTWVQAHSVQVGCMVSRLLARGTLRALQVAAVHASLCLDMSRCAASGLQHLALACERLRLDGGCGSSGCPSLPSIHLLSWVRYFASPNVLQ